MSKPVPAPESLPETGNASELFGGSMMSPVANPWPVYTRLRAERPAMRLDSPMGVAWLLSRYEDVMRAARDSETFSSRGNARGIGLLIGRTILEMEGREHLRQRKLVTPFFGPTAMRERVAPAIDRIIDEMIDGFERDRRADLVAQFTFTFPLRVIAEIIGVPIDDFEEFHHWALALVAIADDPGAAVVATQKIVEYLKPLLEERRREPQADLLSALLHAEVDGERLGDKEVLSFLLLLLPAGAETTYRLTGTLLYALLAHPEVLETVRREPARIDSAIEETLRWESPVQFISRETSREVEVGGAVVPAGDLVMVALGSANRDEAQFPDAARFMLDRPNIGNHIAFGFGEHFCLGSALARLEARQAASRLLARLPNLRFAGDARSTIVGLAFRSPDHLHVAWD